MTGSGDDRRTIIALGGGGFSSEPDNPLLDEVVLAAAAPRGAAKVCFVPTASGDADGYIDSFTAAFHARGCMTSVLTLFPRDIDDLRAHVLAQDVIYVGGGNTANLLAVWRVHGLDSIFREAWEAGVVLAGVSAGANCWFEACTTDSFGPDVAPLYDGLGLLGGSFTPHYDSEPGRRPSLQAALADGLPPGLALGDGCAAMFRGRELQECVGSHPDAVAFEVWPATTGDAWEQPLPVRDLSAD